MSKNISDLAKGAWVSATAYTIGDIVDDSGSSYICIANSTNNQPPNATYWALLADKGDTGPAGPQGDDGPTGPQGDPGDMDTSTYDPASVAEQLVGETATQTLTNKTLTSPDINGGTIDGAVIATSRIKPRTTTEVSSATPTVNSDNTDEHTITALAAAITSMSSGLSGTPANGQKLVYRILDNGTARAIAWGASFQSAIATLPTTTIASKTMYAGFFYNSTDSKWDCMAEGSEA